MNTRAKHKLELRTWTDLISNELMRELERLRTFESMARDGHDPEGVHGMRVAMRRLRVVLMVFPSVFNQLVNQSKELRAELRWIANVLGRVRDLDVILERWPTVASIHRQKPQANGALQTALERLRLAARHEMLNALESNRYHQLLERLRASDVDQEEDHKADHRQKEATRALRRLKKKLNRVERKTKSANLECWHELRKASKRLRYSLELLEPMVGKRARKLIRVLRNAQLQLGMFNDLVVTRATLNCLGILEPQVAAQRERLMIGLEGEIRSSQRDCEKTFRRADWRKPLRQILDRLER
jgi:CHAD domain-containing protein